MNDRSGKQVGDRTEALSVKPESAAVSGRH